MEEKDILNELTKGIEIKVSEEVLKEEDVKKEAVTDYYRSASKYFNVKVYYGKHPLKSNNTYVAEIQSNLHKEDKKFIFVSDLDDAKIKKEIQNELEDIGHLVTGDMGRICNTIQSLKKEGICDNSVPLINLVQDTENNMRARGDYARILRFVTSSPHLFASRDKNDYDSKQHIGCFLDDSTNVKKYGETVLAIESSCVSLDIFGKGQIKDGAEDNGEKEISVKSTNEFNLIKIGLRDLGVLIWSSLDGRNKTTLGTNKVKQCLLFRVSNDI